MRARAGLALLLIAFLMIAGCTAPPPGGDGGPAKLLIGTEAAFPPFEDIDAATGDFVGFDIDLARALAGAMGRDPEFRNLGFDALIPSVQNGQIDMAISAMTITAERQQTVDFTLPYYEANQSVVVRSSTNDVQRPEDLDGKKAGVQRGTTGEQWLVDNRVAGGGMRDADILRYDSFPLAIEALKRGDVDAVMMDAPAVKEAVRNDPRALKLVFEVGTGEQYGIAVKKGDSALLLALNQAIRDVRADGTLAMLKERWGV